jgi:protein-S-isoprenylcysteine O-methyltransferase Ste14
MNLYSKIALVLFGLIALLHVLRLVFSVEIIISNFLVPQWVSYGGFLIFLFLFIGMWNEIKKRK